MPGVCSLLVHGRPSVHVLLPRFPLVLSLVLRARVCVCVCVSWCCFCVWKVLAGFGAFLSFFPTLRLISAVLQLLVLAPSWGCTAEQLASLSRKQFRHAPRARTHTRTHTHTHTHVHTLTHTYTYTRSHTRTHAHTHTHTTKLARTQVIRAQLPRPPPKRLNSESV